MSAKLGEREKCCDNENLKSISSHESKSSLLRTSWCRNCGSLVEETIEVDLISGEALDYFYNIEKINKG